MKGRLILLTEEASMEVLLAHLLPRVFPSRRRFEHWLVIPHQGKSRLEASFPRKLKQWREPDSRFIVLRDNDGADCLHLKRKLLDKVPAHSAPTLIRLVCQEMESWLLGDGEAVATAYPSAARHQLFSQLAKKDPDSFTNASALLGDLTGTAAKRIRTAAISPYMQPERNRSASFQLFLKSVKQWLEEAS